MLARFAIYGNSVRDWERRLLLGLLWPVLWMQGKRVRRTTPRLPEARGAREGTCGSGPLFRLLVAGDSGAAGVGVSTQDQALCGQLVRRLSRHHTVQWRVLAVNGLDSPGLLRLLQTAPVAQYDAVVLSLGANDVTCLCAPQRWLYWQLQLADLIECRFAPGLLVHSAVPPIHACTALPQPLRWFMGRWAREMNQPLSEVLSEHSRRTMHWHPPSTTRIGLAVDGIHPSATGYAHWAEGLSELIMKSFATQRVH